MDQYFPRKWKTAKKKAQLLLTSKLKRKKRAERRDFVPEVSDEHKNVEESSDESTEETEQVESTRGILVNGKSDAVDETNDDNNPWLSSGSIIDLEPEPVGTSAELVSLGEEAMEAPETDNLIEFTAEGLNGYSGSSYYSLDYYEDIEHCGFRSNVVVSEIVELGKHEDVSLHTRNENKVDSLVEKKLTWPSLDKLDAITPAAGDYESRIEGTVKLSSGEIKKFPSAVNDPVSKGNEETPLSYMDGNDEDPQEVMPWGKSKQELSSAVHRDIRENHTYPTQILADFEDQNASQNSSNLRICESTGSQTVDSVLQRPSLLSSCWKSCWGLFDILWPSDG